MPQAHEHVALAGVVLAVAAGAACCALPLVVASGALATVGAWVVNPIAGALVGAVALVIVGAVVRARRRREIRRSHAQGCSTRGDAPPGW